METRLGNSFYPVLYKQDSKGKIRIFKMETSGGSYRTITGLIDGAQVTTDWTTCKPKNVGKSNETTPDEQAIAEVGAKYIKKINLEHYSYEMEDVMECRHKYFSPMLAEKAVDVKWEMKDGKEVILDPKLDGMRMVDQPNAQHSRKGKPIAAASLIHRNLSDFHLAYPTVTLDGELYNHAYHDDFQALMSAFRKEKPTPVELEAAEAIAEYHIYDMYDSENPQMTNLERKQWLDKNLKPLNIDKIHVVEWVLVDNVIDYQTALDKNLEDGYEGSIVRIPTAVYLNKRSKSLIKIKIFDDAEFTILEVLCGKGNRAAIAGSIRVDVNGESVGCGIRGTHGYCLGLLNDAETLVGVLATVRYFGLTNDGKLRFPIVTDINRLD